jgi:hypothetical protein
MGTARRCPALGDATGSRSEGWPTANGVAASCSVRQPAATRRSEDFNVPEANGVSQSAAQPRKRFRTKTPGSAADTKNGKAPKATKTADGVTTTPMKSDDEIKPKKVIKLMKVTKVMKAMKAMKAMRRKDGSWDFDWTPSPAAVVQAKADMAARRKKILAGLDHMVHAHLATSSGVSQSAATPTSSAPNAAKTDSSVAHKGESNAPAEIKSDDERRQDCNAKGDDAQEDALQISPSNDDCEFAPPLALSQKVGRKVRLCEFATSSSVAQPAAHKNESNAPAEIKSDNDHQMRLELPNEAPTATNSESPRTCSGARGCGRIFCDACHPY